MNQKSFDITEQSLPAEIILHLEKKYSISSEDTKKLGVSLHSTESFEKVFLEIANAYNISLGDIVKSSISLGSCVRSNTIEYQPLPETPSGDIDFDISKVKQATSEQTVNSRQLTKNEVAMYLDKSEDTEVTTEYLSDREYKLAVRNEQIEKLFSRDESINFLAALDNCEPFRNWLLELGKDEIDFAITQDQFLLFPDFLYDGHEHSVFSLTSPYSTHNNLVKERFKHTVIEFLRCGRWKGDDDLISLYEYLDEWVGKEFKKEFRAHHDPIVIADEYDFQTLKHDIDTFQDDVKRMCNAFYEFYDGCLSPIYNNREYARSAITYPTALAYRKPHFHFGNYSGGKALIEFRGKFSREIRTSVSISDYYLIATALKAALEQDDSRASCRTDYKTVYESLKEMFETNTVDWRALSELANQEVDWPTDHDKFVKKIEYKIRTCLRFFLHVGILQNIGRDYLYFYPEHNPTFVETAQQYEHYYRKPNFREDIARNELPF